MKNIAVIGGGNIGRRHLQALTNLDSSYNLYVVDPFIDALDLSLQMYEEVRKEKSPTERKKTFSVSNGEASY